ncbi:MAG: riboflavin synthase [Gemmataceae bacterium]|jgi:riboflavin synthase|nr:riboflavin synthase [Gemmataceae bacterium]MBJ7346593.1 riboflavin synthase [Gemmataceae bacterium]MBJ7430507.1 riboflavin synthase [Gemmataceae bacterium]
MFTGIVESLGTVTALKTQSVGIQLSISHDDFFKKTKTGASIAINGVCLTVISVKGKQAVFEAGPETLKKSNLGFLRVGMNVNLEKPVSASSDFSGHFVQGHVDTTAEVLKMEKSGPWVDVWFSLPDLIKPFLVDKGSVCIEGVSLTIVQVKKDRFSVALIPHTLTMTTLALKKPGDMVNIETDMIAKYAMRAYELFFKGKK